MYSAGTAFLTVVPEFEGIEEAFKEQAEKLGRQVDRTIAKAIPKGMREGAERAARDAERHGGRAGERFAGSFANTLTRRLQTMIGSLRDIEIDADTSEADRKVADLRKDLVELRDAVVNVEVDSDFALLEFRRIRDRARELSRESVTIEAHFNLAQILAEAEAVEQAIQNTQDALERSEREAHQVNERREADRRRMVEQMNQGLEDYQRQYRKMLNEAYAEQERRELERARLIDRTNQGLEDYQRQHRRMLDEAYAEDKRRDAEKARRLREMQQGMERFVAERRRMMREAYEEDDRFNRRQIEAARDLARVRGGAFGEQGRRRTEGARNALPNLEPRFWTRDAQRDMFDVRDRLDALSRVTIDVDIPASQYMSEVAALDAVLERLENDPVTIDIDRSNIRLARAELQALTRAARGDGDNAGEEWGGSFLRGIRQAVRTAEATISDIPIGVDISDAQLEILRLKARLAELSNVEVGVEMDLDEFLREVMLVENRLADLEMEDVDIQTRLEAAAARAGLTALHQQINAVDRDDIEIDVDVNGGGAAMALLALQSGVALSRLQALIAVSLALGTAIVPAAAVAAAALSSVATAAAAAAAGIGVLALGLFGPIKAIAALDKYQKDSAKSAKSLASNENAIANALDGVQSAQQGVQRARESAARGAKAAAKQVVDAARSVVDAEREQEKAHRDLVRAVREAQQAEQDRAFSQRSNALSQRQANLDLKEAKAELDKILSNPRATEEEREQAKITYEQRKLQLEELGVAGKRMEEERLRVAKEGADGVVAAQERVRSATQAVADAQERHAEAIEAQTQQRVDSERQIADAVRGVERSQRALAQAYQATATAGGEALSNLKEAMDALSPAGQRFARFIFSLKDEFKSLQAAAEEGLLPGLQEGIEKLVPYLEPLRDLISRIAIALGEAFVDGVEALKDPVWQSFFGYLSQAAVPALLGMLEVIGNVATGIAGILMGLSGFNAPIGEGILQWSRNFAEFGKTVDSNPGFQKFLAYVREAAPVVLGFFSTLWEFTKRFVTAAAPIGVIVVKAIEQLVEWINKIPIDVLTIIIGTIAALGAAFLVVAAITGIVGAVMGSAITAIILGVGLVVGALAILYAKVEPFRNFVDAVFGFIARAAVYLWETYIKPTFINMGKAIDVLVKIFQWLYDHVFVYIFRGIAFAFDALWAVAQVFFGLFQIGMKIWGAIFTAVFQTFVKPFFEWLRPLFNWLGEVITKYVLPPFKQGMENIGKSWDILKEAAKVPIRFMIETILNNGLLKAYNKMAGIFGVKPDDVRVDLPQGFAVGGAVRGPGTKTSDSILARLSAGEHVWTADEVEAVGGHAAMYALRNAAIRGALPGFARGGAVGDESWLEKMRRRAGDFLGGIADFVTDPVGTLKELAKKLFDLVPGKDSHAVKVAIGMPAKGLDMLIDKAKGMFMWSDTGYGNAGPQGGPGPGFLPWPGSPMGQRGDTGVWRSILALVRASGIPYSFGNSYRAGDPLWHGSGRAIDFMGYNQDALANFFMSRMGNVLELIHTTNSGGYYISRGRRRSSMGRQDALHRDHLHIAMDSGGWIQPGITSIYNGTGKPEPVLTNGQWTAIEEMVQHQRIAGSGPRTINQFEFRDTTLDAGKLQALNDAEAAYYRLGRAK